MLGAFVAADVAVVLTVVANVPAVDPLAYGGESPPDAVDRVSAPLWAIRTGRAEPAGAPAPAEAPA